jgi:hypothetical protein
MQKNGCKTTEYKSTDSPLPTLVNVMYCMRVSLQGQPKYSLRNTREGSLYISALKGLSHQMHFLKSCIIKSVLYVHALLVITFLGFLVEEKIKINILLASVKALTELKDWSGSHFIIYQLPSLSLVYFL